MITHSKGKRTVRSAMGFLAAALILPLCPSCGTPPGPEEGLFGILFNAASRTDREQAAERQAPLIQPFPEGATNAAPTPLAAGADATGRDAPSGPGASTNAPPEEPPSYRISPGDILTVSYFARPSVDRQEYQIESQDILTISISGQETQASDVMVRPDGCISFFLIGEMNVRGQTVAQVRAEFAERLATVMPGAEVTVMLKTGNALAKEFLETLRSNTDLGSTRIIQVRHDGRVTFPLVGEVNAMGKTLSQLSREMEGEYDHLFRGGISLALNLNSSSEGNIAVLGEVRNPGRYNIHNPISPFFALAMAGGALDTAKKSQVVVVKRQPDGRVGWHVVNLDLDSKRPLGPEIPLAPQDMLLVPKTGIASLNVFVDQYIRRTIPLSVGYGTGNWQYFVTPR